MGKLTADIQARFVLCAFSLGFFVITAATFTSLGVVLPAMVTELNWDWTTAGLGFTCLGIACGLSSYLPTITIKRWGLSFTLIAGLVILTAGFMMLYTTASPVSYFWGCILIGTGYSFVGSVPGTYVITHFFKKHSTAFGFYYTVGGLGGVVGPIVVWLATDMLGSWRYHWLVMLGAMILSVAFMLTSLLFTDAKRLRKPPEHKKVNTENQRVYETEQVWTFKRAVRTPQYLLLLAAYSTVLFVGITVNSFSVAHLTEVGITFALASTLLSAEAFCNAISRIFGGFIGEYFEPKIMLQVALMLLAGGMFALSFGQTLMTLGFYSFAIGFGFGLTFLSCTVLLVRYFGTGPYLQLFSLMNIGATIAAAAPLLSGYMKDATGTFVPPFLIIGTLPILIFIGITFMRPPRLDLHKRAESKVSNPSSNNLLAAKECE
ncbi:MFS transporter [uncultured Paraglaciecola sp.]|uniref:MFS transporter n=1 Tax=uncultured Paraglaciecola sp. TaxID=1765024 RepID=UPI002596ADA9|nr:MFS transporter [uncultured Paraglaciecola sp.]